MRVEVVRSPRRRKTVQARQVGDALRVMLPATMSAADEARWVAEMVRRFERRTEAEAIDLEVRARRLAAQYHLPRPRSARWVENQRHRWGSCTAPEGTIRLSSRLAGWPPWVLDYVLVHELAHLVVADHGPRFQALVDRYPKAERARGFLIAKGTEPEATDGTEPEATDGTELEVGTTERPPG